MQAHHDTSELYLALQKLAMLGDTNTELSRTGQKKLCLTTHNKTGHDFCWTTPHSGS